MFPRSHQLVEILAMKSRLGSGVLASLDHSRMFSRREYIRILGGPRKSSQGWKSFLDPDRRP